MQSTPRERLMHYAQLLQGTLFGVLEAETGPLSGKARLLIAVLEMIPLNRQLPCARGWRGRPAKDRQALASAFVAKSVYGLETTRQLRQRLYTDRQLRCLCGWTSARQMPHEATFSRAFAEFAASELPQRLHEALILHTQKERLIGHIARDSTAIAARERFPGQPRHKSIPKRKRGRPRQAERALSGRRLPRQRRQSLSEMREELPRQLVAAPVLLATMTAQRVTSLYDLMDCAYDANEIHAHSRSLGHVPLIAPHGSAPPVPKRLQESLRRYDKRRKLPTRYDRKRLPFTPAEEQRFQERSMVERVYSRFKDEFGARIIRVRGASKIMAHLMFGVLALTVDQLLKLSG